MESYNEFDFGTIKFDIKPAMEKYKKSRLYIKQACGLDHRVMKRYYEGTLSKVDLQILARICYAIGCTLDEVIFYEPPAHKIHVEKEK